MAQIIDGKALAQKVREGIAEEVRKTKEEKGLSPSLTVILVGEDPASQNYVRNKEKACAEVGIISEKIKLPASINRGELLQVVAKINNDQTVHGLLIQLPLPKQIDPNEIIAAIDPKKDADGIHPENMGRLLLGVKGLLKPCTPAGVIEMILSTGVDIKGKEAVVVGRSNIVGKPTALMLLERHATVTICHSRTQNLGEVIKRADILVASVGQPRMIKGETVKRGAIVIDVGTNRVEGEWVGDVEFEEAEKRAAYISPVPGGVGPMTIAMLLRNTLNAARESILKTTA